MMKLSRYIASAAVIVVALSTTSCVASQGTAPYLANAMPNRIFPAQGPVIGIDPSGTSCAHGLTTVQLSANDKESIGALRLRTTEFADKTIFVSSSDGFKSVIAGIIITENDTRVPFSTSADGFRQDELSFIAPPGDFGATAIAGIELCVDRE